MRMSRRSALRLPLLAPFAAIPQASLAQSGPGANTLRIAVSVAVNQLDPAKATIASDYIYNNILFNGLCRMNEDLKVEPDIASSWQASADLMTWTFQLRSGVRFHHGREMVAKDVVATFERIKDPATGSRSRTNLLVVDAVEAPDDHTVVFRLAFPYSSFTELLTDRQLKIVPAELVGQLSSRPVGTGPFKFASYVPGGVLAMERHDAYFEKGAPRLARVELRTIAEPSVKVAALQSGDIDVAFDLLPENISSLRGVQGIRVESVPTGTWDGAIMNNETAPFKDVRVRRAFHLAVSKQDVVDIALFGFGVPTHSPIPVNHPFFAKDIPIGKADPVAARKLLAEAGHPNGIKLPIIASADAPAYERLAVTLQQLAAPGGFALEVQRIPYIRFNAEFAGKAPLIVDGYFSRPSIDTATYPFFHSSGTSNSFAWKYSNPKVDEILSKARREPDLGRQRELYVAFQHELHADPASFIPYNKSFTCGYRASVQGLKTHPMLWFDLRRASLQA